MILVQKFLDGDSKYPYWIFFKQGELQTPLLVLDDHSMESMVKQYQAQKKRGEKNA